MQTEIKTTDLGLQLVTNENGRREAVYETGYSATCPRCNRELRGVSRTSAEISVTKTLGSKFRGMEDDAFENVFRAELEGEHTIDGVKCSP